MNLKFLLIVSLALMGDLTAGNPVPALYQRDLPFEMPRLMPPEFPADTFNIVTYGAQGGGICSNTHAFDAAIGRCSASGGGTVLVPAGIWLTGPIRMQSNVNLHLEKGALIVFSPRFEDYPLIRSTWEGLEEVRCLAPLSGFDLENIAVTGAGIIDGSGNAWRPVKKFKMTDKQWDDLVNSGGIVDPAGKIWWPSEGALNGQELVNELNRRPDAAIEDYAPAREYLRPVMVNFVRCKNILLDGPTFQNSPAWNLHPLMCQNVIVSNITVRNPWYSQNGDGIDIESCKNVLVYKSRFDVGDDAICLKSGKNEYGRARGIPSENIVIADCIVYHGHGGFTVGSEMSGGVRNIYVRDCTFIGTDVGLRFKSTRGRGGIVEDIFIENIYMKDIPMEAVRFNMFYDNKAPIPEDDEDDTGPHPGSAAIPVSEETPVFRDIHLKGIYCKGAGQAVILQGLPEMTLKNLVMEDVIISCEKGFLGIDTEQITLRKIDIRPEKGAPFQIYNGREILITEPEVTKSAGPFLKIAGEQSGGIVLRDPTGNLDGTHVQLAKGLSENVVAIEH